MSDKILVYGEYQSIRIMLLLWLESLLPGCTIIEAAKIGQAVEFAKKYAPRAIILNIESLAPQEMAAIGQIKAEAPKLPIMVVTNNGGQGSVDDMIIDGVEYCFSWYNVREQLTPLLLELARTSLKINVTQSYAE